MPGVNAPAWAWPSEQVISAAQHGDDRAIALLLSGSDGHVRRFARTLCASLEDAEEAAQEALIVLYRKVGTLRATAALPVEQRAVVVLRDLQGLSVLELGEPGMSESSGFASATLARHLGRGAVGFGLIGASFGLTALVGPAALLLAPAGLVALRGCPDSVEVAFAENSISPTKSKGARSCRALRVRREPTRVRTAARTRGRSC